MATHGLRSPRAVSVRKMPPARIRIGIVGAGAMDAEHAAAYRAIEGVEIVAVFSRNRQRAESTARICDAAAVTDPFALINDSKIDAIDVCVPSANHSQFVIPALQAGKHVFCETPFALDLSDADAMLAEARKSKRILLVGLLMRSVAQYEHVHRVAASGECGDLLSLFTYRLGSYLRPGGIDHKEHYSDPSTELMTFDFDFIHWLMGAPIRLSASAVNTARGTPGEISALLDYGGDRSATVLASGMMPTTFPFSAGFRAVFEKGAFQLSNVFEAGPPKTTFLFYPEDGKPQPVAVQPRNPFEKELQHFADCIRGAADPALLDAERAIEALTLSIATQRSLQLRQAVSVDSIRPPGGPSGTP
ncbi:MAG: Gfo/Idh/MocA family protein [Candidatus Binataceae bacterium]